MYSMHHGPTPELSNTHGSSTAPSKSTAQLQGFTWSGDSATPGAKTSNSHDDMTSTAQDGNQPRTLYSKLYERFIEKREVFVHSNIDVRRSALINQAQDRSGLAHQSTAQQHGPSPSSSMRPPPTTSLVEGDRGPYEDDDFLHDYWELSNVFPAENYRAPNPSYYSTNPRALHSPVAVLEPPFPPIRPISPPPPHHSRHQPLPARFHSSYSELSANVAFLSEVKSQPKSLSKGPSSKPPSGPSMSAVTSPAPQPEPRPGTEPSTEPPSSNRSVTQPRPIARRKNLPDGERRSGPPSPRTSGNKVSSGKKGSDVKRQPSLACFFCRERKIACGRPAEGSVDRTCNQCARRSYPCDYPTESMRGQHKRRKTYKEDN